MTRMIEPLRQEPKPLDADERYTMGFHDGAYAFAMELISVMQVHGVDAAVDSLTPYARKDARPCSGWTHEPNKPKPENRTETTAFNRPGHWDSGSWIEEKP